LSFSISYWDLIKFPSFVDTIKRGVKGWKGAQKYGEKGDFADLSNMQKYCESISKVWDGTHSNMYNVTPQRGP
jgi:hypothetical protein